MSRTMDMLLELVDMAASQRVGEVEAFALAERSFHVGILNGEIDEFNSARTLSVGIRVISGGRCGYSYTERSDPASLREALEMALENSRVVPEDIHNRLGAAHEPLEAGLEGKRTFDPSIEEMSVEDKIALARGLEAAARGYDNRIVHVPEAAYFDGCTEVTVVNSLGVRAGYATNGTGMGVSVIAREGEDVKSSTRVKHWKGLPGMSPETLGRSAAEEGVRRLKAKTIPSGRRAVILDNESATRLFITFSPVFSARNVQRGLSLLRGKVGREIASERVRIADDGTLPDGLGTRPFDDEGTPSRRTPLVEDGVLKGLLYNNYAAAVDGTASTGNGTRGSVKGAVDIHPTNLYIERGEMSPGELMAEAGEGILVVELQGLHSGASPITGDFSLAAQGYYFRGGRIEHPVHNFTIAGNFLEMLSSVAAVGDDLEFSLGHGRWAVGSPSLLISDLSISGD